MDNQQSPRIVGIPITFAFALFALLVSVNLVYLDILIFSKVSTISDVPSVVTTQLTPSPVGSATCPQSCLTAMQQIASSTTSDKSSGLTSLPTATKAPIQQATSVKEFFIPFGSGTSSAADWTDIPGLEASINTANYPQIKTVTFEATLRIPTGNQIVTARLYNVTGKHPVWYSDVAVDGGTTKLVISPTVVLDPGNNTYQVQLKTSLGYPSYIDQSRIRITTL